MSGTWASGWVTGDVVTANEFKKGMGSVYDTTLSSAAATIDITGLPTTYACLFVVAYLRGDTAATQTICNVTANGDATANYDRQLGAFSAAVASAAETFAGAALFADNIPANTATANSFGAMLMFIPNYGNTSNHKAGVQLNAKKIGVASGNLTAAANAGFWRSALALGRLTFTPAAGNLAAGSRVTVYGMGA